MPFDGGSQFTCLYLFQESMKMMGLSTPVYWLSWFIKAMIYQMISCFFFAVLFAVRIGDNGAVLNNSHPTLVYVFLLCYSVSIVAFAFMISSFFNTGMYLYHHC